MIGRFRYVQSFGHYVFERYNPLFEGGNVFDNVNKINKEDVDATINDIKDRLFPSLGLEFDKNVISIGSAGHADVSGDIDFGVIGKDLQELYATLQSKFPQHKSNVMKGLEVLSTEWPIRGDEKNLVQVDFIPVYDRAWTEFVYRYPEGSDYKSAHRNWVMMAILSTIKDNVEQDEDDQPLSYEGYTMNLNKGLFSIKKDYHGKTKILKHGQIVEEKLVTTDPDKFVKFVFGDSYGPEDVRTFEDCWHIIGKSDFKWRDKISEIKENLKKFLDRVELPIPKELEQE